MCPRHFLLNSVNGRPANSRRSRSLRQFLALQALILLGLLASASTGWAQTFKVLHAFTGDPDGAAPSGSLALDAAGNLYGVTSHGGVNAGTIFKIHADGTEVILYTFTGSPDGAVPEAGLIRDRKGRLFGSTSVGGRYAAGAIFEVTKSGREHTLYSFKDNPDGKFPWKLTLDGTGNIYGTTAQGGKYGNGTVFKLSPDRQETVLYSFRGAPDGQYPGAGVIRDAKGSLYGTTAYGGVYNAGLIYELTSQGKEIVLYSFGQFQNDGGLPESDLTFDPEENLYGTTQVGGEYGAGTIFKLSKSGKETVLYNFGSQPNDGAFPSSGLLRDSRGNFFGVTMNGGYDGCNPGQGCGTVYELTNEGKEIILQDFENGNNGCIPWGDLLRDSSGAIYGTTSNCGNGYGTALNELVSSGVCRTFPQKHKRLQKRSADACIPSNRDRNAGP
jgi:uncharacterized repeat protein (TIGR03803 family)